MWLKIPLCQERKGLWISRLKSQIREVLNTLTSCRLTAPVNSKHIEQSPGKANRSDVSLLGQYGQDLTGIGWIGTLLNRVIGTREEKICPQQQPYCPAPPDCPFHLGFMSFCTISMDCEPVQLSWRDFSTPDFPGFNIYYQEHASTDPDSHEIHLETQCNSHQHTGPSQHLSVLQTNSPLPSLCFHTRACSSHGDRTDLQLYPLLSLSL